jgi:tripeptide aminopeptidase
MKLPDTGLVSFVATVGEEGLGDLRGVKVLFAPEDRRAPGPAPRVDQFVAIDGTGIGITNVAVGSRRYRVTFTGPGGHSFASFGLPNPIDAMGRAIAKIAEIQVPKAPRTTFNVGRVSGGTSVNAIPAQSWMEVDMRSADPRALRTLETRVRQAVEASTNEENARWRSPGVIRAAFDRAGERPSGETPPDAFIVRAAQQVNRSLGLPTTLSESSTDANIPISLHIPAITIGAGGRGGDAHALTEWFDATESWKGTARAVLLTLALESQDSR